MADFSALKTAIQNAIRTNGNEEITGQLLQDVLISMVTSLGDDAINDLVTDLAAEVTNRQNADGTLQTNINNEISARQNADGSLHGEIAAEKAARQAADGTLQGNIDTEATQRQNADTALQNAINAINTKLGEGYVYAGIATTSTNPGTPTGKVFYIATGAGTYTNFIDSESVALVVKQGINILKFNGTAWSAEQIWGIDDVPTAGSENLVKSGGVVDSITEKVGVEYVRKGFITSDGQNVVRWYSNGSHLSIPVSAGDSVVVTANSSNDAICAIALDDVDYTQQGDAVNIDTNIGLIPVSAGSSRIFTITSGGVRLLVDAVTGSYNRMPVSIKINGYDYIYSVISNILGILDSASAESVIRGQLIEKVDLTFETGYYYNNALVKTELAGMKCAEISANKGEVYILHVTSHGSLASGVVDSNNNVVLLIPGAGTATIEYKKNFFIPSDGCKIRVTKYGATADLYKVNLNAFSDCIEDVFGIVALSGTWGQGFYNNGTLETSYMPETYGHTLFEIPDTILGKSMMLKLSSSNTGVASTYDAFDIFDENMVPLSVVKVSTTSQNFNDYAVYSIPKNAKYISVATKSDATASVKCIYQRILSNASGFGSESQQSTIGSMAQIGALGYNIPDDFDYSCLFTYGQSLAQGGAAQGALSLNALEGNYTLSTGIETTNVSDYSGATLDPLKLANVSKQEHPVIGAINALSTLWRRYRNKNCKFIGLSGGYSGAQIEVMMKGSTYYTRFIAACTRLKAIADAEGKTIGCIGIVFMQGESNYIPNSGTAEQNKSGYKDLVRKLKEDLQGDLKTIFGQQFNPIFFMYETGYKWIRNNHFDCSISQAQLEMSQELDDVVLLNPTYQITVNTSLHPNYNGYRWYGELIAKGIWNALYHNNRFETVMPIGFHVDGKSIIVDMYAPVYPIRVDTHTQPAISNKGFTVRINGVVKTIYDTYLYGNSIVIELTDNIDLSSDMVEVSYAGLNVEGQGNICDSDTWRSLTDYEDDSATSPYNTPNLQYPVAKRPLDINGKPIYGKKYPMQNWLTNFYENLSLHFVEHLVKYAVGETFTNDIVNTTNATLTFTSSDTDIATVTSSGEVTALASGSCYINASVVVGGVTIQDNYLLIVES